MPGTPSVQRKTKAAEQISSSLRAHTQFNLAAVAEFRQETITIGITVANAQNGRMHNLRGSCERNYVRGSDLLAQIAFNLVLVWPGCVRLHCALSFNYIRLSEHCSHQVVSQSLCAGESLRSKSG
jgi:hypothetical protein